MWLDKVYPLLKPHLADSLDSVSSYMLLYHGATLANLLEVGSGILLPPVCTMSSTPTKELCLADSPGNTTASGSSAKKYPSM